MLNMRRQAICEGHFIVRRNGTGTTHGQNHLIQCQNHTLQMLCNFVLLLQEPNTDATVCFRLLPSFLLTHKHRTHDLPA